MVNEGYSNGVDVESYQVILERALSKVDYSVGTDIYILPSNLNLNLGKTHACNNKILISNTDMNIDSNKNINKAEVYHHKSDQYQSSAAHHMLLSNDPVGCKV